VSTRVVILGAGFGGLELSTRLSAAGGFDVTLIDQSDGFIFGFSKFELMLGRETVDQVKSLYRDIVKPGVEFRQEVINSIDPVARRAVTDKQTYDADILVVALGADYDFSAPPGFREGGYEFYSVEGALVLRDLLPSFTSGRVVIAVLGEPFKCPPAPCEAAMLLDDWFEERGVRPDIDITLVHPWGRPLPPSPDGSKAILNRFAERNMTFMTEQLVTSIDPATKTAQLRDGGTLPYDLFLGIPKHRVPAVVEASGLAIDGWVPVDKQDLSTRFPNVYAVGDVTSAPVPKAGFFAEGAAGAAADHIIAQRDGGTPAPFAGIASCYVEFGDKTVGRVDADFYSGPTPKAPFTGPSLETAEEKKEFAASRRRRWFRG
jgi:sulfide:quinone oxidoreductase